MGRRRRCGTVPSSPLPAFLARRGVAPEVPRRADGQGVAIVRVRSGHVDRKGREEIDLVERVADPRADAPVVISKKSVVFVEEELGAPYLTGRMKWAGLRDGGVQCAEKQTSMGPLPRGAGAKRPSLAEAASDRRRGIWPLCRAG